MRDTIWQHDLAAALGTSYTYEMTPGGWGHLRVGNEIVVMMQPNEDHLAAIRRYADEQRKAAEKAAEAADPYPHWYEWCLGLCSVKWLCFNKPGEMIYGFDDAGLPISEIRHYAARWHEYDCLGAANAWQRIPGKPQAVIDAEVKAEHRRGCETMPCGHARHWLAYRNPVDPKSEQYCLFCEVERLRGRLAKIEAAVPDAREAYEKGLPSYALIDAIETAEKADPKPPRDEEPDAKQPSLAPLRRESVASRAADNAATPQPGADETPQGSLIQTSESETPRTVPNTPNKARGCSADRRKRDERT